MDRNEYHRGILLAIDREALAHALYREVYEHVKDPVLKGLFWELAAEEGTHRAVLEGYLEQDTGGPLDLPTEGVSLAAGARSANPVPAGSAISDGLLMAAIGNELDTIRIYTGLVRLCDDARQKKVFTGFASVEHGHKSRLEGIYTSLSFPDILLGRKD